MSSLSVVPEGPRDLGVIVAANVRAELARRGLRQAALVQVLGLGQASVSERMSGKKQFTLTEVGRVADFLGVGVAVLCGEAAPDPRPGGPGGGPGRPASAPTDAYVPKIAA